MTDYPSTLPCPQIEGYQVDVDYGMTAVTFEHGNKRQRRSAKNERHIFSLSLVLTLPQLWTWQSWANQFGYSWHKISLESHYAGLAGKTLVAHTIRYISDITIEPVDADYMRVSFQAEMDMDTLPAGVVQPSGNWVIGGTPPAPSPNWIIAGTPPAPSTDTITAGTPATPAA
jgi:hypothetical protein